MDDPSTAFADSFESFAYRFPPTERKSVPRPVSKTPEGTKPVAAVAFGSSLAASLRSTAAASALRTLTSGMVWVLNRNPNPFRVRLDFASAEYCSAVAFENLPSQ